MPRALAECRAALRIQNQGWRRQHAAASRSRSPASLSTLHIETTAPAAEERKGKKNKRRKTVGIRADRRDRTRHTRLAERCFFRSHTKTWYKNNFQALQAKKKVPHCSSPLIEERREPVRYRPRMIRGFHASIQDHLRAQKGVQKAGDGRCQRGHPEVQPVHDRALESALCVGRGSCRPLPYPLYFPASPKNITPLFVVSYDITKWE